MELLGKYLAGEASPEEAAAIDDWRSQPENKNEFDTLLKLHYNIYDAGKYKTPEVAAEWAALLKTIASKPASPTFPRWLAYAAAACCIGIVGIVLFTGNRKNNDIEVQPTIVREASQFPVADTLSDGSVVTINKGSRINYPAAFTRNERVVKLQGESYFSITPDPQKPFIIHISGLTIRVIGTEFNVKHHADSNSIDVQVTSGIVRMSAADLELEVSAGETGIYNMRAQTLVRKSMINRNSVSYATRSFYFNDISLEEACAYLENAFQVRIVVYKKESAGCRLTAQFTDKSLEYILEVINATLGSTSKQVGNIIELHATTCE